MDDVPIFFEQRLVGTVDIAGGGPGFCYDRRWLATKGAFAISLTMPLRPERYAAATFVPWAANLLPESEQLRAVGQFLGTAPGDVIGLLAAIGRDTAGALSIGKPGGTSAVYWRAVESADDLERIIEELPNKPFLVGREGVSMSLAGVQSKLAVAVDEAGRICIPTEGSPSTHILKPDAARLRGGIYNEAFCLTLARRLGLTAVELVTGVAGKRTFLLVRRYDRIGAGMRWRRRHQEDFCQALGKPPAAKYENNQTGIRGPTLKEMFDLTRRHLRPTDVVQLLDMIIFNVLACNTDAHAKNYSIMIGGQAALAPLYDVMCGEVWEHVTKNLAQAIAGTNRAADLDARRWQRFAAECGLNGRQVLARVRALAGRVLGVTAAASNEVAGMPAGGHPMLDRTREAVEARARSVLALLEEVPAPAPESREMESDLEIA
jgi:serine/threonine-protein kinase HipA